MKKAFLGKESIGDSELALINAYTTRALTADEVYAFSVVLCDNEIDRDFERFTTDSLKKLAELFVGKPGIFDHSMKGKDQIARIYSCAVEETGETTSFGEPYVRLKARAYLPKTSKTEDFILNLEAGIFKEVSVGCAVESQVCSVCGTDNAKEYCTHHKGEVYEENNNLLQCHRMLVNPTDAYEWSFVAVPAQRRAGVVKAYKTPKGESQMSLDEIIKGLKGKITLSEIQSEELSKEFLRLKKIENGYLCDLKKSAVKNCAEAFPELCGEQLDGILAALSPEQIKAFDLALTKKQALKPQLAATQKAVCTDNGEFVI